MYLHETSQPDVYGGCWPNAHEILLLKAAILKDRQAALFAWESWFRHQRINAIHYAYKRLFPLVWHNFKSLGMEERLPQELKQNHRRTWHQNQLLFHNASQILHLLGDAGIEVLVLKGLALAQSIYDDCGLRPMSDMDLLVRPEQVTEATDLLMSHGWIPTGADTATFNLNGIIASRHGWDFHNKGGLELDLHWQALEQVSDAALDRKFWRSAVSIRYLDVSALTLNATDHLFHVCLHGTKWNRMPPLRWVADAAAIINHPVSEIQWERLVGLARKYQLVFNIYKSLAFLHQSFNLPIPPDVLESLQWEKTRWDERIVYYLRTQPPWPLGQFLIQWQYQYDRNRQYGALYRMIRTLAAQHVLWRQRLWQTDSPEDFFTVKRWVKSTDELLKSALRSLAKR